jgi:ATP-dependent Clp endopeptidase proteolytic subunit ClpP
MSRRTFDSAEAVFSYGIDPIARTLYMGSVPNTENTDEGVNFEMAEKAIKGLLVLDGAAPTGNQPITIIMNSPGGDETHGRAIYDAVLSCRNEIRMLVYGQAYSMASIILQAADRRVMAPSALMMIHYGLGAISEKHPKSVYREAKIAKRLDEWSERVYLQRIRQKHPNYRLGRLRRLLNFDTYLTAQQAVELGLADEVMVTRSRKPFRKA